MQLISRRLRRRTDVAGGDPLITYYDLGTDERTELSAITVSNWVDKTCHLLVDEYGIDLGDVVLLDLARTHPGHWVTACWELACWRLGATVAVDDGHGARLVVTGPVHDAGVEVASRLAADVLACSLHPLALPFTKQLPAGVGDYALEVRGQPDQYAAAPVPGHELAWRSTEASLTQAELDGQSPVEGRRLLRPTTPWPSVRDGILAALLGGGSVVVAVGDDAAALERIRATENIDGEVGFSPRTADPMRSAR
jgi:uncharacterized protein (TIGR03089 family)